MTEPNGGRRLAGFERYRLRRQRPIVGNETKRELMTTKSDSAVHRCLTALPVYNEARHIPDVLAEVRRYSSDILVIDDGSSDDTPTVLAGQSNLVVVTHERNLGYGAALRTAFDFAMQNGYDVLVTIDCDGQHQPRLIPELAAAVFPPGERPVDIVSGSRYLRSLDGNSVPPEERRRINVAITQLVNDRLGLDLTDAFCGFKAYRVEALKKIKITELGYAMPLQFWAQAAALGLRIVEFPVPLVYLEENRSFGGSLDDGQRRLAYYQTVLDREIEAVAFCPSAARRGVGCDARVESSR
jgi:glycosyltransferase involved in cell wall biosynthesis